MDMQLEIETVNVESGNEDWSSDTFDCFENDYSCLMAFFCPWVLFGENYEIISQGELDCFVGGLLYTCLLPVGSYWILAALARSQLRNMFNLSGSTDDDCTVHIFCHWCALAQEYRELRSRDFIVEEGWSANKVRRDAAEHARLAQQRLAAVTQPAVQARNMRCRHGYLAMSMLNNQ